MSTPQEEIDENTIGRHSKCIKLFKKQPSSEDAAEEEEIEDEAGETVDEAANAIHEDIDQCFALFDKNNTGTFEIQYLEKALRSLGIFLTSFELKDLADTMNGAVEYEKFRSYAFEKLMEVDAFDSLRTALQAFDPENEGVIPTDRFKRWMMTYGNPLTEKEAKELAKLGDPSNKGLVVYDDLVGVLLAN